MSLENAALPPNFAPATIVNLNPAGTPSQLTIGTGSADKSSTTFSGSIVGAGGNIVLNKGPNGRLALSGANTYSGSTSVNGGTLQVTGSLARNGSNTTFISAGTDFTLASLIRRVQPGGSYAGLGATAGGIAIGSMADIRAGKNKNATFRDVAMQWRVHNTASDGPGLISDVLNLSGMSSNAGGHVQTDAFALQMTYSTSALDTRESSLAADGLIDLAWLNSTLNQPFGIWQNATMGNFGAGLSGDVFHNYQGSWDTFAAANLVTDSNVGNFLGSYGVDIASRTVWAIVNHNSQFAVVPEPSSLILLAIGGLVAGVALVYRRRCSSWSSLLAQLSPPAPSPRPCPVRRGSRKSAKGQGEGEIARAFISLR
jgi:autotransporter-associated beta strand protein